MKIFRIPVKLGTLIGGLSVLILGGVMLITPAAFSQWQSTTDFDNLPSLPRRPVEFYREKIIMNIDNDYLEVTGIYYFRNNIGKAKNFPLVYPFPIDECHNPPDSISIKFDKGDGEIPVDFRMHPKGTHCSCVLPMKKGDGNIMTVFYRQLLNEKQARYILTTTAKWGKPFDFAEYEIAIPEDFDDVFINYPFTLEEKEEAIELFKMSGEDFMPDKDIIVKWK
ncbi:MAG: hypothetical protein GY855_11320 [candidate division Zixibacteria bacterium]|nr:hypothetical protein [candidate division Zixibacteria bacterium]